MISTIIVVYTYAAARVHSALAMARGSIQHVHVALLFMCVLAFISLTNYYRVAALAAMMIYQV